MKKYLIALIALLLLIALPVTALAAEAMEAENADLPPAENANTSAEPPSAEGAVAESFFTQAKEWLAEHGSGLIVSLVSLYMACPKIGGVAAILKVVREMRGFLEDLKKYLNDKKNPDSLGNKISAQGDVWVRFMNELMPKMEALERGLALMEQNLVSGAQWRNALLAVEESVELMAKEFNDLISISTTVSPKQKAIMEADFMAAKEHLHQTVKGALGVDEQGQKKSA